MYSNFNEGKSVAAEIFITTLKKKIYKHMNAVSSNVYFEVLVDIVKKDDNLVHRTIIMKPIDGKSGSYAEYNEDFNKNDPKFKVGDDERISKHKNIFAKVYAPNWLEEVYVISKVKNAVPWIYVICDLNGKEVVGSFYEKELQKTRN